MKYIIAKNAANTHWDKHFTEDPGITGLHYEYSAYNDCSLKPFIQPFYNIKEYERAQADCASLAKKFPEDGYAVTRLISIKPAKVN